MADFEEIERKFLVDPTIFRIPSKDGLFEYEEIRQSYIAIADPVNVRVRQRGSNFFITVKKHDVDNPLVQAEVEPTITDKEAMALFNMCDKEIVKTRYYIPTSHGLEWELDVFHGALEGLILAEIELSSSEQEMPCLPAWIVKEVTNDHRYSNASLYETQTIPEES